MGYLWEGVGGWKGRLEIFLNSCGRRNIWGWRWKSRGVYREVLILLATLTLLIRTQDEGAVGGGKRQFSYRKLFLHLALSSNVHLSAHVHINLIYSLQPSVGGKEASCI
jgi:hypothetical protein